MNRALILVNFGGPRTLQEITPFLTALLIDQDVVQTKWPSICHRFLFSRIARKRAVKIQWQYEDIGGCSPIFADTEAVAEALRETLKIPVVTFHRYLPETHAASFSSIINLFAKEVIVLPFFPQFTYATTGSIARLFFRALPPKITTQLRWIKSYAHHPAFIKLFQQRITDFLILKKWRIENTLLLFTAHGVPQSFVDRGDPYERECRLSYEKVMEAFPTGKGLLSFQSKFGPGEWIKPYTSKICEEIVTNIDGKQQVLFIPLSFTSDHIETLFEIEKEYLPLVTKQGIDTSRLPAFNRGADWVHAISQILEEKNYVTTSMLIRN